MKKVRILQVTGSLHIGGIEKLVLSFFQSIDREKFEMDFLVFGEKEGILEAKVKELGGRVFRIPSPNNNYLEYYKNLKNIMIKNGPYDIVHSHVLFNSGIVMRAAFKCKVPVRISHSHDNLSMIDRGIIRKIYINLMRFWLLKYSTKICACSSLAGNYLFGKKKFLKSGIIIYNSIELEKFTYDEKDRISIRKKYNISTNDILIGNIGRVVEQKNQKFLIDLLCCTKNTKLCIVGDGHLLLELKEYAKEKHLENRIIFTGSQNDVEAFLSAFDVFALSSIHEGLGIVLIEAQANGLPCIAPMNVAPDEAKILDNFIFCDFPSEDKINDWIECISKAIKIGRIYNPLSNNKMLKYDVKQQGKILEDLYNKK